MLGGNFVNRFNIAGRSYKVIPQIERSARLNPSQLEHIYVTGPENQLVPLSTIATIKNSTVPRSLNKLQQLNAVTIQGVAIRPLDQALKFLETEAHKILPKGYNDRLHGRVAAVAHRRRQVPALAHAGAHPHLPRPRRAV